MPEIFAADGYFFLANNFTDEGISSASKNIAAILCSLYRKYISPLGLTM